MINIEYFYTINFWLAEARHKRQTCFSDMILFLRSTLDKVVISFGLRFILTRQEDYGDTSGEEDTYEE